MATASDTPTTTRLSEAAASRRAKLLDGLETLRSSAPVAQLLSERTLMAIAGAMIPVGLLLVLAGWWGAAHTPYLFEQVPYLISGGLLGLGLIVLGGFVYFAHWITELVKEQRSQTEALVAAIDALRHDDELSRAVAALSEQLADQGGARRRSPKRAARS